MSSIRDAIRASLMTKDIRPSTRRSYWNALRPFLEMDLETLSASELSEVLYSISNQNTRRKVVIALRACVDHPAVKALKVPEALARVYDLPDETTLRLALMTSTHETRALLMAYAGLRIGEACAVTRDNIKGSWLTITHQVDERTSKVVPVKVTGGRVPLPGWLIPRVEALDTTAKVKTVRKALDVAGKRTGIKLNPHMLRHWYATELVRLGHPPNVVQRLLRHRDIKVTFRVYAQVAQGDLEQAVKGLGTL